MCSLGRWFIAGLGINKTISYRISVEFVFRGCIREYRESLALLVKQKESEKGGVNSLSARDVSTAEATYSA